ncbi:hypothetical protein AA0116_g9500 [Alternaria tenuissima]|nr:hypothetical protein AA0116_g9500 [Alternaria tenuissima]
MFTKAIFTSALLSAVSAHQNMHQLWVNDVTPGYQVGIRMPPSNSPVTDVTSDDIVCNVNGAKVPSGVETVAANEGDTIKVHASPVAPTTFATLLRPSSGIAAPTGAVPSGTAGVAKLYYQCGGAGYTGPTTCEGTAKCVVQNDFYSQCLNN